MHPATMLMLSRALADEHRREADRRRRTGRQPRHAGAADRGRQVAWPFSLLRPKAAGSGA